MERQILLSSSLQKSGGGITTHIFNTLLLSFVFGVRGGRGFAIVVGGDKEIGHGVAVVVLEEKD